jgi:hypothetical protein
MQWAGLRNDTAGLETRQQGSCPGLLHLHLVQGF